MQNIDHHTLMYINHVMKSHEVVNEMNSDTILFRLIASSWVLDLKSVELSWNFFEKVSSWIEKLNSRTQIELRSLIQQLDSKTWLNLTRY